MKEHLTRFQGLKEYQPTIHKDSRGMFLETFRQNEICSGWVQDNLSITEKQGTFRGFHAQYPSPQMKLVRCVKGAVLDIVIDIRGQSETYLESYSVVLSDVGMNMLLIPQGFLHGFYTLTDDVIFEYKVSEYYEHKHGVTFSYDDPSFDVPLCVDNPNIILSANDDVEWNHSSIKPFSPKTNPFMAWNVGGLYA
jgi:dTDP-4-dehydrorhamnose 3,5-epimerase